MFNWRQILSVTLLSIALPLTTASAFAQQVARPATSSQLSVGGNSTSTSVKCYGKGANGENLGSGKGADLATPIYQKLDAKISAVSMVGCNVAEIKIQNKSHLYQEVGRNQSQNLN